MKNKKFEILKSLPAYGPMYIPISEQGTPFYSEGFPVRFYKSEGDSWVANFELGRTDFYEIFELDIPSLLIISGGQCFIMNPDEPKPIEIFGGDYINYLKSIDGRIILYNKTHLTVIDSKGSHWDSEQISLYGLGEMKISEDNIITGLFYEFASTEADDLWIPFEYNIDAKSLMYDDSLLETVYKKYLPFYKNNKKPWWKLYYS